MYPMALDPNRQDNIPSQATIQFHMHQLCCPCSNIVYPCYPPGYRPPILAQPSPIPRPSYLHHYQFTQLHLNPAYSVPIPPTVTQPLPPNVNNSSTSTVDLAFGPPPRDRRILENHEFDEQRSSADRNKSDCRESFLHYGTLSSTMDGTYTPNALTQILPDDLMDVSAVQVANMSTENFIAYLVNGCMIGEKIAKRNEHRPCFKNIQNLCNRTRSEVVKPNITVSNIHSQGMPWATKDFIFAFVRAINCWCILRGYLSCKDGNLGKIEREITPEFRSCYNNWEKCTKQLTYYLIETFCRLDEANSSSNINANIQSQLNSFISMGTSTTTIPQPRSKNETPSQDSPCEAAQLNSQTMTQSTQTLDKNASNKDSPGLKGIPGILHIPRKNSSIEIIETKAQASDSNEICPRDEDSDCGNRVYMKPGSYNVPTRQLSSQQNSPRSIEFLESARNVKVYQRKQAAEKLDAITSEILREKLWQTAQSVTPEFIRLNEETPTVGNLSSIDKLYNISITSQQNRQIEKWLNSDCNQFDCAVLDGDEEQNGRLNSILQAPSSVDSETQNLCANKPVVVLKRSKYGAMTETSKLIDVDTQQCNTSHDNAIEFIAHPDKKKPESEDVRFYRRGLQSLFKKTSDSSWEHKSGGLTEKTKLILIKIFQELERTEFGLQTVKILSYKQCDEYELKNPTELNTVYEKLRNSKYMYLNEFVHDIRHIVDYLNVHYVDIKLLKQLTTFKNKFEELMLQEFPTIDFSQVTGSPNESALGPYKTKEVENKKKNAEICSDQ